jgi:hypothetical protein
MASVDPKMAGSGAGSISQRHGIPDPDPYQNETDPQHWSKENVVVVNPYTVVVKSVILTEDINFV